MRCTIVMITCTIVMLSRTLLMMACDIDGDAAGVNDTRMMIATMSVLECCYTPILVLTMNVEDSGRHPRLRVHDDNDEYAADKNDGNDADEDNKKLS